MDTSYNPLAFEKERYKKWESSGVFAANIAASDNRPTYMITMPPPNVTGVLHMGHALFLSIQDTYTRWKRMLGYNTLWLPGTDHAGIATQVMVERQVEAEGTSRAKLGREEFLKRVWKWKNDHGGVITQQMRAMGASCDWSRELFTMDPKSSLAVKESFARLYHEGLIYRGERIVNWSSGLQTAISDLEVEQKTTQGALYYLKYLLSENESEYLTVATTRPETIFADVAVAVHPDDERWKKFHGKEVIIPLSGRRIPVILDEYVDREFGTGALKITPGHDVNDWKIGQKHKLRTLTCIGFDGKLNDLAGEFAGQIAAHSRKKVAEKIKDSNLLVKEEKHTYELGYCQRSGVVVEPLVSMQWFVRMESLAKRALSAAEGDDPTIRFYPDYWKKTYFEWLTNIQDWCISRQLWWGHQIPAWHCRACAEITVPQKGTDTDPQECHKCGSTMLQQDTDVLDTWYSSALWPISTLGWPENTPELEKFYPQIRAGMARDNQDCLALMETGSDILFFWVARMLMMCSHFMNDRVPFEDIFLHAMVRDEKGQKMSKTKGNVIDPLEVTEKHGADSLRITLLALSGQGKNVNLDLKRLEGYKAYLNKLWNASRFVLFHLNKDAAKKAEENFIDRWIRSELDRAIGSVNQALNSYRPDAAFQTIYQFTWYEFCDWYLELLKVHPSPNKDTVVNILKEILTLLHPLAPFVTEEIYQNLPPQSKNESTLILGKFPQKAEGELASGEELNKMAALMEAVNGIRNFRTENKIPPKAIIDCHLETKESPLWQEIAPYVSSLAKLGNISIGGAAPSGQTGRVATAAFVFTFPLAGLVDTAAEKTRLQSEIKKAQADLDFTNKRLENPNFVARAKPELVEQERENARLLQEKICSLQETMNKL